MTIKIVGAILVIIGCGGFGFLIAAAHRYEVKTLQTFLGVLDIMECELQYRQTSLPELCRQIATGCKGVLRIFFSNLAHELDTQIRPSVDACVQAALSGIKDMPTHTKEMIVHLGRTLGSFDIKGQLVGIGSVRDESMTRLEFLRNNQDVRIRSYQTLGVCAGAAMAILFI